MILVDLVFVFIFALILSSVLCWGCGWRHPSLSNTIRGSGLFLFMVLMFTMWAAGAWLPPWGPLWYGTAWLNLLFVGLLVSLLVLATTTPVKRPPRTTREAVEDEAEEAVVVGTAFGIFFWVLLVALLIAVAVRYLV